MKCQACVGLMIGVLYPTTPPPHQTPPQQEVAWSTYIHFFSLSHLVFVLSANQKKVSISNIKREDQEGFMLLFNLWY